MKIRMPQSYFSKLMRAIVEFEMIQDGDKILIGVSGGKDSIFLTYALACMRERLKKDFSIAALTINPMFPDANFDVERIRKFVENLDVPFDTIDVDIAGTIEAQGGKNPCFTCAFFRRGAMNRHASEHGYNKIAYAHHNDDAVETFLMSLLYSGQIQTFLPVTYLDRIPFVPRPTSTRRASPSSARSSTSAKAIHVPPSNITASHLSHPLVRMTVIPSVRP